LGSEVNPLVSKADTAQAALLGCTSVPKLTVVTARQLVQLDDASMTGIDLKEVALQDPRMVYAVVGRHLYADGPLTLSDVVEAAR
jgi:hypothetical protein